MASVPPMSAGNNTARTSLGLGVAQAFDYLVQLALPLLLVRVLGADGFATYRTWWLVVLTMTAIASLNLPGNLIYWLAQRPPAEHGRLVGNVIVYLLLAALGSAAIVGVLVDASPHWAGGASKALFLAAFCATWLVSIPFDQIGIALGRPALQVRLLLAQTGVRIVLLGGGALLAGLDGVSVALLALASARALAWLGCVRSLAGVRSLAVDPGLARTQARYTLAFGLGATLFALRAHADGWIAGLNFGPHGVASVAIAASIVPVISLARQAVIGSSVSRLARLAASGQLAQAMALNHRANLATALCVFPAVAAFLAVADPLISWLYTSAFAGAADLARGYAALLLLLAVEVSPLVQSLGHGRFVLGLGAGLLAAGMACSALGAHLWGLPGLALGAAVATLGGSVANLMLLQRRHGVAVRELLPLAALAQLALAALAAGWAGATVADLLAAHAGHGAGPKLAQVAGGAAVALAVFLAAVQLSGVLRRCYSDAWRSLRTAP